MAGNQKIDALTLPNESGVDTTYDIDLPVDADISINSIVTAGDIKAGGIIYEGGTGENNKLQNKYQAKGNYVENSDPSATGKNGKIAQWAGAASLGYSDYTVQNLIDIAESRRTGYVTDTTNMPSLDTDTADVTVSLFKHKDGNAIALNKFNIGDAIYLLDTDIPDRWVSAINTTGSTVNSLVLTVLEGDIDLSSYSKNTHYHLFTGTAGSISVSGTYKKVTGVTISVGSGETPNYTPSGSVAVTRDTDVAVNTDTVYSITAVGTLPALQANGSDISELVVIDSVTNGEAMEVADQVVATNGIKAVSSAFTGNTTPVTTEAIGEQAPATYTPAGTVAAPTHNLGVDLAPDTTAANGTKYLEDVTFTAPSAGNTETVLTGVKGGGATPTNKYMKFSAGTTPAASASFSGTKTNSLVTNVTITEVSGTAKYLHASFVGSTTTFTGTFTPAGSVGLISGSESATGYVSYIESVGSVTATKGDYTPAGTVTLIDDNFTTTNVLTSINGGSGTFKGVRTTPGSGTSYRRLLTISHTHVAASAGNTAAAFTGISNTKPTFAGTKTNALVTSITQNASTVKYLHASFTGSADQAISVSGTPLGSVTLTSDDTAQGGISYISQVSGGSLTVTKGDYTPAGSVTLTPGTAPSLQLSDEAITGGQVFVSGITSIPAEANGTAVVLTSINAGSLVKTTKYLHPAITGAINAPAFSGTAVRLVNTASGSITNTPTAADTKTVKVVTKAGTHTSVQTKTLTWSKGTLPTKGTGQTVATSIKTQPVFSAAFTGSGVKLIATVSDADTTVSSSGTFTPQGTIGAAVEPS